MLQQPEKINGRLQRSSCLLKIVVISDFDAYQLTNTVHASYKVMYLSFCDFSFQHLRHVGHHRIGCGALFVDARVKVVRQQPTRQRAAQNLQGLGHFIQLKEEENKQEKINIDQRLFL